MTHFRPAALCSILVLALGACSKSEEQAAPVVSDAATSLFSHVPADTPYLAGNLEPVPSDIIDAYLARAEPVLAEMQQQLTIAKTELTAEDADSAGAGVVLAVLEELDGKLNREGLKSLGFDIQSNKVFYGMGAFPVARLGLSDAAAFRSTIVRIMDRSGIVAPESDLQGRKYWRLADDSNPDEPLAMYIAILDDHLAIGLFPFTAENELLPAFLGIEKPANGDAAERLAALNRKNGYTPYGSGTLDLHALADRFLQADTVLARTLAAHGGFDPASLDPACADEIHGIIDHMPVMDMGTTELTTGAIAYDYRIHHPESLAQQLMGLVSRVPAASAVSQRVLEFAFGMRFGPVRDFIAEKATAVTQDPYQCEQLADLNQQAIDTLERINQPMPPFVNNFRGVRISLNELLMLPDQPIPQKASGHLAVHVEQPQMFVGMAQMFLPDLSGLELVPGDPPVAIPETLIPVPGYVAYAAMSDEAIGLSLGAGEEAKLPAFLNQDNGPEGMFLSADYDMADYLAYTAPYSEQVHAGHGDDGASRAAQAIGEAAREAFSKTADRSRTTMSFTPEGLLIEGRLTFK